MVRMKRALSSAPTFAMTLASLVHAAPSGNPRRGVHSEPSSPNNIVEFDQDYLRAGLADYLLDRSDDGRNKDHTVYLTETYTTVSVSTVSSACSSDSDSVTESYTSVSSYGVEPIVTVGDDAEKTGLSDAASRTTETDGFVTIIDIATKPSADAVPTITETETITKILSSVVYSTSIATSVVTTTVSV